MKNLIVYIPVIIIIFLFQADLKGQCSGDLNAQNLAVSPSTLYSCGQVTVTAEWLQQAQENYDADFHVSKLILSLPNEFIGTTGTLSITSTDNNSYWNNSGITVTDNEIQVPLQGLIPTGVGLNIVLSNMDMFTDAEIIAENLNISQSVTNAVADCVPTNDEQSIMANLRRADGPLITDIQSACTENQLAINLSAQKGPAVFDGNIDSYSWTGPNGYTSEDEDPSFIVPEGQKDDYTGTYMVTVTDANGCTTESSIDLDGMNCLILPIELLNFQTILGKKEVKLEWETATELNNSHFDIERSQDGRYFTKIGSIKGHGTTSEVIQYIFTDQTPLSGKSFYRLKQVDFGGTYKYSHVEDVFFGEDNYLKVFPNPVAPGSEINIHGQKIRSVKIFNLLGQLMIQETYDSPQIKVIISSAKLSEGIYIARVNGVDEKKLVVK